MEDAALAKLSPEERAKKEAKVAAKRREEEVSLFVST